MYPSAARTNAIPSRCQNLVHLPLVYGTAKIIDDETRDATGKLRILAFEHLVYVYLLHRVFPLVRPASVSTFP